MIVPFAGRMRDRVLAHIAGCGAHGCTDFEGEAALDMITQTYTPRRRELVVDKLVRDSGRRRLTARGRPATVWVVVEGVTDDP